MENLIGRDLGRYHIIEQLGEGGMAVVYKAFDTRLEADVAVKVIRTENLPQSGVERALKRFEREAKALAKLTHPNIVPIIDYGEYESSPYLVMKYLPGGTLKQFLSGKPIPWQEVIPLLIPVARALDYAHRQNMIHRDVKPSNILITGDGEPMLTDFGIAKILDEEGTTELTGTSTAMGTPEYMAPEQVVSKKVDHRADIYALGIIFYEMVTGRRPFKADTPMAVLFKHASEPLPHPSQFVPDLPEEVEKLLFKALAKNPDDRYPTMGELAAAFERLLSRNVLRPVEAPVVSKPLPESTLETLSANFKQEKQAAPSPEGMERGRVEPKMASVSQPQPEPARAAPVKVRSARPRWMGWAIGGGAVCILLALGGAYGLRALVKPATPAATKPIVSAETEAPVAPLANPGSGPGGSIPFPAGGKSVTGGWTTEPDNITPYWTQMAQAIWITQLTLAGLGEWDDRGNLVPELAVEIPSASNGGVSADNMTITWHLRKNLKWSDGHPLTSEDVKFTWGAVTNPNNSALAAAGYDQIANIDTPDDTTVVIHFKELYPAWQTLFTQGPNNTGAILPRHILEGKTGLNADPFIHWPTVSSGPWVITDWAAGDYMTLWPNPLFYKGRPKLDQVLIKFIPDLETALAALQTGDIDWYPDFSESDIEIIGSNAPAIHLLVVPLPEWEHYFFNLGVKGTGEGESDLDGFCPFKDVRVRQAITLGINRKAIVDNLLAGKTIVPATQWSGEWANTSLRSDDYDPEKARVLLEDAGYTRGADGIRHGICNGVDTRLSFNFETTTRQMRVDIALAVHSDLKEIGIEFKPIHTPVGTFFASYSDGGPLTTGKFDMGGYTSGFYPDPMTGALNSYACNKVPSAGNPSGVNNYHLCDRELDQLLAAVNVTVDPVARKAALDKVQRYIFEKNYVIMIYARAQVCAYVERFVPGAFGGLSNMNWNSEVWDVK